MTREEAKLEFEENYHSLSYGEWAIDKSDFEYIINKIYESFENRTCENCKFGMTYHFDDEIQCVKIEAGTQGLYFEKDFYCKYWESKGRR